MGRVFNRGESRVDVHRATVVGERVTPTDRGGPAWRRYLRFWGSDPARDLDDEMRFHLDQRVRDFIALGMTPDAARAEAEHRFGDQGRVREQCATIDSQWERERSMKENFQRAANDVRHAVRQLRRNPSLSVAAILCLALGIGANTSIFSVVNGVLFRPLPFADDGRLVLVGDWLPQIGPDNFGVIAPAEFTDYSRLNGRIFTNSAVYGGGSEGSRGVALSGGGLNEPQRVSALTVSPSLFPTLGVTAALGRTFNATDDTTGGANALLLSFGIWQTRFGGGNVVGQSIDVDGRPRTIVGVMPRSFRFPIAGAGGQPADVFIPLRITPDVENERGQAYDAYFIARLAPDVTLDAARGALRDIAAGFPRRYPQVYRGGWSEKNDVFSFRQRAVHEIRRPLLILLGAVGFVLLIACINVGSLLLARAAARQREIAVRQALGASRLRLVQQFLSESLVLAVTGGSLGLLVAVWGARVIAAHAPSEVLQGYDASVDGRVLIATAVVVLATAVFFSLVPALGQGGRALGTTLREDGRGSTASGGRARARRYLVGAQVAMALMLAATAGLMTRSFLRAQDVHPGFEPDHLIAFRVGIPEARYATPASVLGFDSRMVDAIRGLPGVASASASLRLPMQDPMRMLFAVEGKAPAELPVGTGTFVMPDYFHTMRIPLLAGRAIEASDVVGRLPVVVVNRELARTFFGSDGEHVAVGKRIKWGTAGNNAPWLTIVGVAADVKDVGLDQKQGWSVYFPALQAADANASGMMRSFAFLARAGGDDGTVMRELRQAVRGIDPTMPIVGPTRLTDVVSVSIAARRFNTYMLGAFALLALVLASVGIYGLIAYLVVQRTREIGLRLALGALRGDVVRLVVGEGAKLALIGVIVGLVGTLALSRVVRTLLFDVSPLDPLSFVGAAALLLGVAVVACLLPAWKAARTDPQTAIRA